MDLFNDVLDDAPAKIEATGFSGVDFMTNPRLLQPNMASDGANMWADVDLVFQTRPGMVFNSGLAPALASTGPAPIQGMAYYDTTALERTLAAINGRLFEIIGDGQNAVNNLLTGLPSPALATSWQIQFAQLIDRMFYNDGTLRFSYYTTSWNHGNVTTFSDSTAMPAWKLICSHVGRILAVSAVDGQSIYASAILSASANTDWLPTQNIKVGNGQGDPVKQIISGQGANLIVLCERSAWSIDCSDPDVSNWVVSKLTDLTGCVEGKTAIMLEQDIAFLSRYGVVSLQSLVLVTSVNEETTLSAPVRNWLNRINWAAIGTAWATTWDALYLLAIPIDNNPFPTVILPYHLKTQQWQTPWECTLPDVAQGGGITDQFEGFSGAVVTRFNGKQETIIADTCGRMLRFDPTYEMDDQSASTSQDVVSWITTKAFDFSIAENYKQPFWFEVEFHLSTADQVQINLVRDGFQAYPDKALNACEIIVAGLSTNQLPTFPLIFPIVFEPNETYRRSFNLRGVLARFREARLQMVSLSGRLRLRTVRLAAFIDTPALVS